MTDAATYDELAHHEFETTPFTAMERETLVRYKEETAGIPDSFESFDVEHLHYHVSEYGLSATTMMLRQQADALNTWYLALDSALGGLLLCTSESSTYSTAAARFLRQEGGTYHQTRQDFEHAVTVWTLGRNTRPMGDYPPITRTLNLAMQSLEARP